jgi:hypothetical protein
VHAGMPACTRGPHFRNFKLTPPAPAGHTTIPSSLSPRNCSLSFNPIKPPQKPSLLLPGPLQSPHVDLRLLDDHVLGPIFSEPTPQPSRKTRRFDSTHWHVFKLQFGHHELGLRIKRQWKRIFCCLESHRLGCAWTRRFTRVTT